MCEVSAKNIELLVAGARQSSNFSGKYPGFSEVIEVCLNLGIEFCITWLVLSSYKIVSQ